MIKLLPFQKDIIDKTKLRNKVAYYLDMGLGKTFVGSEKLMSFNTKKNIIVCQKSKLNDWIEHIKTNYPNVIVVDLTNKNNLKKLDLLDNIVGVINYDLLYRRPELLKLKDFSLLCDESSMLKNSSAKRTKTALKLQFKNVVLLSGTPVGGKYEELWSQCKLLGWDITKKFFYDQFIITKKLPFIKSKFIPQVVVGYKNINQLKEKLRDLGCIFLETSKVLDLPDTKQITLNCDSSVNLKKFNKDGLIEIKFGNEIKKLIANFSIEKLLINRMLCGIYNKNKLDALKDILNSTNDRLIIFYNFWEEYKELLNVCKKEGRPISSCNGKGTDLDNFKKHNDCVLLVQYQSGAMGLNLQQCNKIVYFTPPLSSELFEQSKKRIHRIGQNKTCFYYKLVTKNSVENKIYKNLDLRRDYTAELFKQDLL